MNIKLILSYDGSRFNGSQKQPTKNTVQDELESSLERLNIKTNLIFSGRTDKNVHATGQVVSTFIPHFWNDLSKLKKILNQSLPSSIYIKHIYKVSDDFHARFSAKKRTYRYIISSKPTTPFNDKYLTYHKHIDQHIVKEAISYLIGQHNFKFFSKNGSNPKSTIREIYDIKFYRYKEFYIFKFTANSYLRSQIRMLVSFLLKISDKELTISHLQKQLNCTQQISWSLAPANGLYLTKISF